MGRTVASVHVNPDATVMDRNPPAEFRALAGRSVLSANRKGKYLWLTFDRAPHLLLHFAMTGSLEAYAGEADRPKFLKLELAFTDGTRIGYTEIRRFGRVRLLRDPAGEPPVSELGFDAWKELPSSAEFIRRLAGRNAPIKAVLLDQSFAAGVGNWIADEVLYQAGIDPRRPASALSPAEMRRMRECLERILAIAVKHDAFSDKFPPGWLFHVRWGKTKGARTADGHPIEFITVGGRTTAFVPGKQS